ncbi:unnamed protein product [marine sediment metagenome]|uniref:Uncharacterized protein n=1 Tax=marine sediment metagenome TaxID=412755 RepID=X1AAY7_9ZZZZ
MRIIFTYTVQFDEEALKSSGEHYINVEVTKRQLKLIRGISKIICEFLNIPELPMKATAWNALREWQIKNNMSIAKIPKMPIGKGLNAVKEIFCIGKRIVKEMVKDHKEKNEIIIDIVFEKAFMIFLEYYDQKRC